MHVDHQIVQAVVGRLQRRPGRRVHDIAGPADAKSGDAYTPKGGSGFGVRTLLDLASSFKKPVVAR